MLNRNNVIIITSILLLATAIIYFTRVLFRTEVSFQSSDGGWFGAESNIKGRYFQSIVIAFEYYKLKCDKPNAVIQRVTIKPKKYSIESIVNNYNDPKWKIQYHEPHHELIDIRKLHSDSYCYRSRTDPVNDSEYKIAKENARVFLKNLN